jgi:histidinol-phosphate aminotransferase
MVAANVRPEVASVPAYRFRPYPAAIKLDQNESPDDLPEEVRQAAVQRLRNASWNRYPDLHPDHLAARLGERHGWPADGVVVAGGSNVLIQALIVLSGIGRAVVTLAPSFSLYELQARVLGAHLLEVPLGAGHAFPAADVARAVTGGAGVAFLPIPLAPTGNGVTQDDVRLVVEAATEGWTVVLDEAYAEFAGIDHGAIARAHPRVVRLRTMSKAFALAGVRIGYALLEPALATELRKVMVPFSVSALQVAVAEAALDAPDVVEARVRRTVAERERLSAALSERGVRFVPSVANFLMLDVRDPAEVHRALLAQAVLVRRQDHLPGLAGGLRVSIGRPEENDAFLRAWDALPQVKETAHG